MFSFQEKNAFIAEYLLHLKASDFQQGHQDNSIEKEQSFQQTVREPLNINIQRIAGPLPYTINKN